MQSASVSPQTEGIVWELTRFFTILNKSGLWGNVLVKPTKRKTRVNKDALPYPSCPKRGQLSGFGVAALPECARWLSFFCFQLILLESHRPECIPTPLTLSCVTMRRGFTLYENESYLQITLNRQEGTTANRCRDLHRMLLSSFSCFQNNHLKNFAAPTTWQFPLPPVT